MDNEKQQNPFAGAGSSRSAAEREQKGNSLQHGFPAWDLVPPHAPVRKGADA